MKTIMVSDRVYELLKSIKGDKSFGELIEEIFFESINARKRYIMRFFGILKEDEAEKREKILKEVRKNVRSRLFGYLSDNRISKG